jgi:hypothetical protein
MTEPNNHENTESVSPNPRSSILDPRSSILDPRSPRFLKRRNRSWIWVFLVFGVLGVAGAAILWIYNVNQQLKPEQLARARKLWQEKGPRDYTLVITKEGSAMGTFVVTVRGGAVESVVAKDEMEKDGKTTVVDRPLEKRLYSYYDMDSLFDDLQRFLEIKADPDKGRAFLRAHFDAKDGHLQEYVYSNSKDRQRVRVVVQLQAGIASKPLPSPPTGR